MNLLKRLAFISLLAALFSCAETSVEQKLNEKDPSRINVKPSAEPTSLSSVMEELDLKIYNSYEELEFLFNQNSDTTYVINFWATWCKPCVAELPYFEELNEVYEEEKVRVVLVSLDFKRHIQKQLIPFLEKNHLASEVLVLLDGKFNSWIDKVSPEWSGAIPATLIYNSEKRLFFEQSFEDFDELNNVVKPLIKT